MSSMFEINKQDHLRWCLTLSSSSFETRNNHRYRQHRRSSRTDRSGWNDRSCCTTILLQTWKHNCHSSDHCHDHMLRSSSRYEIYHSRSFHSSWRHTRLPSIQSRVSCSSRLRSPHGMCRIPLNTTNRSSSWIPSSVGSVCMERCSSSCESSPIPSRSFHRAFRIQPYILPRIGWSSRIHQSFVETRSSCEHGSPWIDRRMEWSCWWNDWGRHNLELHISAACIVLYDGIEQSDCIDFKQLNDQQVKLIQDPRLNKLTDTVAWLQKTAFEGTGCRFDSSAPRLGHLGRGIHNTYGVTHWLSMSWIYSFHSIIRKSN